MVAKWAQKPTSLNRKSENLLPRPECVAMHTSTHKGKFPEVGDADEISTKKKFCLFVFVASQEQTPFANGKLNDSPILARNYELVLMCMRDM